MKKITHTPQRGFTLIETLVGITLLIVVITAVVFTTNDTITASAEKRDEVTAFFLAQEAIEIVRNVRDNNTLQGAPSWLSGLSACTSGGVCRIDPTDLVTPASSCVGTCPIFRVNSAGIYQYSSGENTVFSRDVTINEIVTDREAIITVTVYWTSRGGQKNFTITDHLFNWQ